MKWTDVSVGVFEFDSAVSNYALTAAKIGKMAEVTARRPYGCVVIRVDSDKIIIESQDGDGKRLECRELIINDLVCDGEADPEDNLTEQMKSLDDVPQAMKEAGIGPTPNPLKNHGESEGQEAGRQEEGQGEVL